MTLTQKYKYGLNDHPVNVAFIIQIGLWLLAVGLPYALEWVTIYGPSYNFHRSVMSMEAWGWLFVIGGIATLASLFIRNPVIKFAARSVPSVIIMVWTVLWYVAAFIPGFPGWSAVPTYTFIALTSILTFYSPAIARRWSNE